MKLLAILLALALAIVSGTVVLAQSESVETPAETVQVVFDENFVIELPADWLTWRHEDFPIASLGSQAIVDMFHQVNPDFVFPQSPSIDYLRFTAAAPTMVDGQVVAVQVTFLPLSAIDALVDQVDAMRYELIGELTINGRDAVVLFRTYDETITGEDGTETSVTNLIEVMVISIFPEQDTLAITTLFFPPSYFDANSTAMATTVLSVRLVGEPFDDAALAVLIGDPEAEATPEPTG